MPEVMLDCVMTMPQPFITPIYDFTAPRIVFGRVAMVGDAAANARPHMGFGVAKAGGDAQALANALRDHDDIDTALKAYNAERQPIGNTIVMHSRKLGTHMGVNLKTEEDRRMHALLQERRRDDGLDRGAEFPGRYRSCKRATDERAAETRLRAQHAASSAIPTRAAGRTACR